ncbi:MAG TPA: cation diffusion facilitator family transporter, partial [bacterium]|nr:cation diffusion facilitator family transporter [bacterium]
MTTELTDSQPMAGEKHRVALASVLAAVALTVTKLGIGWWTNSLGILAEALHSGLDLVAAIVTLWAVKISAQPADGNHPYGHGKFENLSALFETLLLLGTCVWIIVEAVERLRSAEAVTMTVNGWAFAVVLLSIVVDYGRSRALMRAARKYQSQALEADALHFSTDIWSSGVVLLGLCGVLAGDRLGLPWLRQADAVAALGVALIVIGVSYRLGKKSIDDLLDAVPAELRDTVVAAAAAVPGVESVRQVRARKSGPEVFADVTLAVGRTLTFAQAHHIADEGEAAIRRQLPNVDVTVHVEPVADAGADDRKIVRLLAAEHGLATHNLRWYETDGQRGLELHLEVDDRLSVQDAHQLANRFEAALREEIRGLVRIDTHLEPCRPTRAVADAGTAGTERVRQALAAFFTCERLCRTPHAVNVQECDGRLAVTLHCVLPPATPITAAHALTEEMEAHLRRHIPEIERVV